MPNENEKIVLPPCPLGIIRGHLQHVLGYEKVEDYSTALVEVWVNENTDDIVRFPIDEDPMRFSHVIAVFELQLRGRIASIPFYAQEIARLMKPRQAGEHQAKK